MWCKDTNYILSKEIKHKYITKSKEIFYINKIESKEKKGFNYCCEPHP